MSKVSIIVPAYQAATTIGRTVDSLLNCHGAREAQILVIDDGSTDATTRLASRPGVEVLRIEHAGRPIALNHGIAAATGEVILFTDADCIVPPNWIEDLLLALGKDDGVGGNLVPERCTVSEAAKMLRYIDEFQVAQVLTGDYTGVCLNGNNMAIRRQSLDAVGGFDESFLHGADADLTSRLLAAGCQLRRVLQPRVIHLKVDSFSAYLHTCWQRGSTVRFGMKNGRENTGTLLRALFLSPWKWLLRDFRRVPGLKKVIADLTLFRAYLAPCVNFLGGLATGLGRIAYYRRFRKGGL